MRPSATAAAAALLVAVLAAPAAAANPVLDPADDVDVAATLAEATEVQDVCYGYVLTVDDGDTGQWGGTYAASSAGPGTAASDAPRCTGGVVELDARITYTSSFSEAEDSASWQLRSTLPELTIDDVEDQGLSAGALLDDGQSATTLLNAVLLLPRLAAEQAGLPPVVLEPNPSPLPADARPTGSPGSDWLRENAVLLALCAGAVLAGLLALVASSPRGRGRRAPGPPAPAASTSRTSDPWRTR